MEISTPGSTNWQTLLDRAVELLDDTAAVTGNTPAWALGGGTVLMFHYRHRTSRDIDIFLHDAQVLTLLTPRLNDRAAEMVDDYVEASNFVKLSCRDGEIDFIIAPDLSDDPHEEAHFRTRPVTLERPVEIAVKKAFYRAAELRARDVFDLAIVIDHQRESMLHSAAILRSKAAILRARLAAITPRYVASAANEIAFLPDGAPYLRDAPRILADFLAGLPQC
jgi:hypothetical protein